MTPKEAQLEIGRLITWLATEANLSAVEIADRSPVDVATAIMAQRGAWQEERAADALGRIARAMQLLLHNGLSDREAGRLDAVELAVLRAIRDAARWHAHVASCRRPE